MANFNQQRISRAVDWKLPWDFKIRFIASNLVSPIDHAISDHPTPINQKARSFGSILHETDSPNLTTAITDDP